MICDRLALEELEFLTRLFVDLSSLWLILQALGFAAVFDPFSPNGILSLPFMEVLGGGTEVLEVVTVLLMTEIMR